MSLVVTWLQGRSDVMAASSYTAEFGAGVVVNGLDLNTDATNVLVGGRKGGKFTLSFFFFLQNIERYRHFLCTYN